MRALPRRTKASAVLAGSLSRRTYAQPAPNPPPLRSGSSSHDKAQSQSQWRSTPFATAQTLTLFSSSPEGLLIALRSTLQGMLDSAARVGPAPGAKPDGEGANHVLLYAVSKSLPPAVLGEAVSLLRGAPPSTTSESPKPAAASAAQIARMGVLSDSIPASLLPVEATGSEATPGEQLHSVALSLLPGSVAVPFRSTIPGRAQVQVGRWPAQKDSWRDTGSRVDMLEEKGEERGWEEVWGRENVARTIPAELQDVE